MKFVANVLPKASSIPKELCHYTTVKGLMGIIEGNAIWASNVSFLNDKQELRYGIDAAIKVLANNQIAKYDKKLARSIADDLKTYNLPNTYAACFCLKNDLLSQWRGYGGKEQGVCITFDGVNLRELFRVHKITAMSVVYDKKATSLRVEKRINTIVDNDYDSILIDTTPDEFKDTLISSLAKLAPIFKDSGFSEKQEWRFVIQGEMDSTKIFFRESAGIIIPYLKLTGGKINLPIRSITIGPGNHQELVGRGIKMLLEKCEFNDVSIEMSKIPYRT